MSPQERLLEGVRICIRSALSTSTPAVTPTTNTPKTCSQPSETKLAKVKDLHQICRICLKAVSAATSSSSSSLSPLPSSSSASSSPVILPGSSSGARAPSSDPEEDSSASVVDHDGEVDRPRHKGPSSRGEVEPRADAKSLRHLLCNLLHNPLCSACELAKMAAPRRPKGTGSIQEAISFGDAVTADLDLSTPVHPQQWNGAGRHRHSRFGYACQALSKSEK